MAGINFMGSYSGIDGTMIEDLMKAERMPLVQYGKQKTSITETQNAWKDINTRLNSLFEKIKNLSSSDTFQSKTSTSTNEDHVSITPSKNSIVGIYNINVEQLATNTNIIGFKELEGKVTDAIGQSGSFTIKNSDDVEITIEVETENSLKDIVNKINDKTNDSRDSEGNTIKGSKISATIIDNRIILTDEKTGERNISLKDVGEATILSHIGLKNGEEPNKKVIVNTGNIAKFTINGVGVERDTNSITDVIEYSTINLKKTHEGGKADTVNISMDSQKTTKAVQDFVDQYNSTIRFIEDKMSAGDPKLAGSKGTLAGDSSLMRLHSSLRQMVTSAITNGNTDIKDISQLGVETIDKFGQLKFDSSKLQDQLKDNPEDVINFFASKDKDDNEIGFINRINTQIDGFISKENGIIKTKNESYDKTLKDLSRRIEDFETRMERKEKYYIKMFSALDVAMMKAEGQMTWLQGQVDAMNMGGRK